MPEPMLKSRSALAGFLTPGHYGADGVAGVTLSECRGLTLISIAARAGQAAELSAAVAHEFGATLPMQPARTASGSVAFLWSGPDFWLALGSSTDDLARRLADVAGSRANITDLTGSRTIIRISGTRARYGMMKVVPIDLAESVFAPGSTALTIAFHIPVQLWQVDDTPTYEIACPRSYAVSLCHHLMAAFAEYGYRVA